MDTTSLLDSPLRLSDIWLHDYSILARRAQRRLKERYGQQANTLSGGEQQMMVIGRALMAKPRLLLLDEPSLGIAPKLVQDIARSIVAISRDEGVSVLLVEQNSRMALSNSQRAYALTTGTVALSGVSKDLMNDNRIKAAYLGGDL